MTERERAPELRKHLTGKLPAVLDEFYNNIMSSPAAHHFPDPARVEPTKAAQTKHWENLFQDIVDPGTFQKSEEIGSNHLKVGLAPTWYIAAYGWIMMKLVPELTRKYRARPGELAAVLNTLIFRLFSDMAASQAGYEKASVQKAVQNMKDANTDGLGKLAQSVAEVNDVVLRLAFLQRNSNNVANNGQTISSAATELVSSVEEIAQSSNNAATEAEESNVSVANGRTSIGQLSNVVSNIAQAVHETSSSVDELSEASNQIGQMLSVIEGIAQQTNLLALNATIEAARAGEAGKGFAVVASEVKQLATQTAQSTDDIAKRITALRDGMAAIQHNMQTSTEAVTESAEAIDETSGQIDQFAIQVESVSRRMTDIAGILTQQKGASGEIAQNIAGIAEMATDSYELVKQIASSMNKSTSSFMENARQMFNAEDDIALCYMAKIDHVMFKKRVVDTCMGADNWTSREVPDHHNCRLGKWYDAIQDESLRALPAFQDLVQPHEMVHSSAKRALEAAAVEDTEAMTEALNALDQASVEVLQKLDALSDAIKQQPSHRQKVA